MARMRLQLLASLILFLLRLTAAGSPAAQNDWRYVDGKLPFDEAFLHDKPIKRRDSLAQHGGKVGIPLQFGWPAARISELGSAFADAKYVQQSEGKYCDTGGHSFLFEGTEHPEHCLKRCTEAAACTHFTAYTTTGWCQLR
eukprot:TRINITY_DN22716_c0_g1_i1.p1 TRINITY_DN22716_c0_g1~~TRINITY_DN22716_c0_g1_i1.p1  ORF type:complete len:141 (-),score=20.03 TRINITY_DN22716_c0_g1_i1:20-442(-)